MEQATPETPTATISRGSISKLAGSSEGLYYAPSFGGDSKFHFEEEWSSLLRVDVE